MTVIENEMFGVPGKRGAARILATLNTKSFLARDRNITCIAITLFPFLSLVVSYATLNLIIYYHILIILSFRILTLILYHILNCNIIQNKYNYINILIVFRPL